MKAIVIEQAYEDTRLAWQVHQSAALERIRLSRAKVVSRPLAEAPAAPIAVTFSFKSKAVDAPPDVLRLEIAFRMAGFEKPDDAAPGTELAKPDSRKPEPVVSVECAYEVDYELDREFAITPEHVRAFKDGNAIFNAWPYFREYLQNNLQRMGFPALAAPFLRLQPKPKPRKKEKVDSTSLVATRD